MINIVLSGGSGTRLWPLSRAFMPKQFVPVFSKHSLFQSTIKRNQNFCSKQIIVANQNHYFLAKDQLSSIGAQADFILEPIPKNTAPAIALAAFSVRGEDILFITPCDHMIKNEEAYAKAVSEAMSLAKKDQLVTFGIRPTHPETGYGYIECDHHDVLRFIEKPSLQKAQSYCESGNFLWNSGMFCFKASVFLEALREKAPDIFKGAKEAYNAKKVTRFEEETLYRVTSEMMALIPSESIDYAVMEKSENIKVVKSDIGWSDVGSFDSLYDEMPKDESGNTLCTSHINEESTNNLIVSEKTVATVACEDLIIVDTPDALLVAQKGSSQKVRKIVEKVRKLDEKLTKIHTSVYRPWGSYEVLFSREKYKIKRIIVKAGHRLSLQKHFHRSEHWVVVSGTANVRVGNEEQTLRVNESTFIRPGELHRLENPGHIPLILIEVQVGEYTEEDDIVRLEDDYDFYEK